MEASLPGAGMMLPFQGALGEGVGQSRVENPFRKGEILALLVDGKPEIFPADLHARAFPLHHLFGFP